MTRVFRWFQIAMATAFLGTALQFPGADCGGKILRNVNPCGTIIACDPLEYDLAFSQGDYPDYDVDPTCTIPGLCGNVPFPVSPGTTIGTATPGTATGTDTGNGTGGQ